MCFNLGICSKFRENNKKDAETDSTRSSRRTGKLDINGQEIFENKKPHEKLSLRDSEKMVL